ncbi:MAG: P-II family nitrogen regulator [Candidatus Binatia bacterium]
MKMIWAVVRSDKVELIARQLKRIGVNGCTVYPVRGYGEQWKLYEPLMHGGHHKLEAIVKEKEVKEAVREITENGSTGREGDGILSVLDLGSVVKIRSREQVENTLE